MSRAKAYRATQRFGLGARPGELSEIADDPAGWLTHQIVAPVAEPAALASVGSAQQHLSNFLRHMQERRLLKKQANADAEPSADVVMQVKQFFKREIGPTMRKQFAARVNAAVETSNPYRERLIRFWSNHFTVSIDGGKRIVMTSCVPYENEAIRRHVDGRFSDMLLAVEQHPVMLVYLDNNQSFGPNSRVGRRRKRGLNENLAREILELHTLGVNGSYSQQDVTSLARAITGWTVSDGRRLPGPAGTFRFVDLVHEPGDRRFLGKAYREDGVRQGERMLMDLARHPSTAQHLATKLVRHFVADEPPAPAVERIAALFRSTDGHLPSVHRALLELPQAWARENVKLKSPSDLVVSTLRGLDIAPPPDGKLIGSLKLLNQLPFSAPSPAGWPDVAEHWGSPNALMQRIDWAVRIGERIGSARVANDLLEHMIDPQESRSLALAVSRAASSSQAIGLLLASPHHQWR